MKINLSKILAGGLVVLMLTSTTAFATRPGSTRDQLKPEVIRTHEVYGTAEVVSGNFKVTGTDLQARALNFIASKKDAFKIADPPRELKLLYQRTDKIGETHLRFQQEYNNLEVWGCQTIVHFKDDHTIYLVGGQTIATPSINTIPSMSELDAASIASDEIKTIHPNDSLETDSKLLIYPGDGNPSLAYLVTVTSPTDGGVRWRVFVDAQDGHIVHKFNDIQNDGPDIGTGIDVLGNTDTLNIYNSGGQYQLRDVTHTGAISTYYDYYGAHVISTDPNGDKVWNDNASQKKFVSGHYYTDSTYNYYISTFGRDSYDGAGSDIPVNMLPDPGYNNAYWNGQALNFGEGDGVAYKPFSGALDVVAHELTHAVTEYNGTGGLIYEFQSGALNESFSDVMAAMVDRDDWTMGEDIALYTTNPFIRSLENPSLKGQPNTMDQYHWLGIDSDNGGVHTNSGISNHAAYIASEMFGLGRSKVEQIWYRTLTTYLTPTTGFHFWAAMTLQATADLYSASDVNAMYNALKLVALLPTYADPTSVTITTLIGGTPTPDTVWIHNSGPGDSYTYSFGSPSTPGLSVTQVAGADPVPVGDSIGFEVALSTSGYTECDLGVSVDTVNFLLETGAFSTTIRLPITVAVAKTTSDYKPVDVNTSCTNFNGYNNTEIYNFDRSGVNTVYDGSLMIGLLDGNDTTVYRSVYGTNKLAIVDTVDTEPGSKSFDFVSFDGRIQGKATYRWDDTDPNNCDFVIVDFDLYNPCDTPLTIIAGAYTDFDILSSSSNTCHNDPANNLVYIQDNAGNYAAGMARLNGTAKNVRSISNPALVYNGGWDDGIAYSQMAYNSNLQGLTPNDYSALLTFGQTTLVAGDTAHYSMAYMYQISGGDSFVDILNKIAAFNTNYICGDANGDGDVNLLDILSLISFLYDTPAGPAPNPLGSGDANGDGDVNLLDILYLIAYRYNTPAGPAPVCP